MPPDDDDASTRTTITVEIPRCEYRIIARRARLAGMTVGRYLVVAGVLAARERTGRR